MVPVFIQYIICLVVQLKRLDPVIVHVHSEWMKAADMQHLVNDNWSKSLNWNSSLEYTKNPPKNWEKHDRPLIFTPPFSP